MAIVSATPNDFHLLAAIGKESFIESHGSSGPAADIEKYANSKYNDEVCMEELNDPANIYHFIYHNDQPAGYSKIIFNVPHQQPDVENTTKLERLYLLKKFYALKLGLELFHFNIALSKQNNQAGMWLYVWKENKRAVDFYLRSQFKITGSYDFKLTENHSNPNHRMLLNY